MRTGQYILDDRQRSHVWVWILFIVALLMAIIVLGAGVTGVSIFGIYQPKKTYLQVSSTRLEQLVYILADGVIRDLAITVDIVSWNSRNGKANITVSEFHLALGYHSATLALLSARPFNVTPHSSMPLNYDVHMAGTRLDTVGQHTMSEDLMTGLVRLDLDGKARLTSKVSVFLTRQFWTRLSCPMFFTTDGIATIDEKTCRSWSP